MGKKEMDVCDLCEQDGEETEAVGWYTANDGDDWDVCKKHARDVKEAGFKLNLFDEEEED